MTGPTDLVQWTKLFALRVMKLVDQLPRTASGRSIGNQLLRSGTSVGANYRAAKRARSKAEFRAKLGVVEEEADEACYWLELIGESGMMKPSRLSELLKEGNEITAIIVASIQTSRKNDRS